MSSLPQTTVRESHLALAGDPTASSSQNPAAYPCRYGPPCGQRKLESGGSEGLATFTPRMKSTPAIKQMERNAVVVAFDYPVDSRYPTRVGPYECSYDSRHIYETNKGAGT